MPKINMRELISRRSFHRRVNTQLLSRALNLTHINEEVIVTDGHFQNVASLNPPSSLVDQTTTNSINEDAIVNDGHNLNLISLDPPSIEDTNQSSDENAYSLDFQEKLKLWAINNNIKHTAVNELLKILRPIGGEMGLPKMHELCLKHLQ